MVRPRLLLAGLFVLALASLGQSRLSAECPQPIPVIESRQDLGRLAESEGFLRGAELGVLHGSFSKTILELWPSAIEYWLVDLWCARLAQPIPSIHGCPLQQRSRESPGLRLGSATAAPGFPQTQLRRAAAVLLRPCARPCCAAPPSPPPNPRQPPCASPRRAHQENYDDAANIADEGQQNNYLDALDNTRPWADKIRICRNFTTVCAERVDDGYFDYVYVDARHDRKGVLMDLEAWWPKVRQGGILAGALGDTAG